MPTSPLTWFITGCSSGFGETLVRQLRASGDNVIATGRNAESKLAHLKDTGAAVMDFDVTISTSDIEAKVSEAWGLFGNGIDVVVNNAGFIMSGAFEELTVEDFERTMNTNFHGPLNITRAFLPYLRGKGSGTLLYISSQAGWHADPAASAYCASKFALEGAIECLYKELTLVAPAIKVLIVEPGYYRTRAFTNINYGAARVSAYAQFSAGSRAYVKGVVGNEPGDPDRAVERIVELVKGTGMASGRTVPLRVPLGSDGLARVKAKCEDMLKVCDEWEDVAKSTDFAPS
ncbi:NAD(P)-binding protein [Pleurostoma richardsiae]|uniref:NAD(P)-binding protein n=1 Tax=Pleurostoma richardsiae TaxID=41990 RepID=A0AA38RFS4_9PEZI|nr:NAD(P)-binding protein [Pleurostoma richardsiae]